MRPLIGTGTALLATSPVVTSVKEKARAEKMILRLRIIGLLYVVGTLSTLKSTIRSAGCGCSMGRRAPLQR
jgi:hypothetical protein